MSDLDVDGRQHRLRESSESLKICVIGGGAAGLAALKVIHDSEEFQAGKWDVIAYEAREDIGGVWLPAPPTDDPPLTPLYDSLTTNLPHPVMSFPSLLFPKETPLFPKADAVLQYLKLYAKEFDLMRYIKLNVKLISAAWNGAKWIVKTTDSPNATEFDRIVVANGHYRVPYFPPLPGLDSWRSRGKVTHSAWYRSPHYIGDVVLVVGGGPSGRDLSQEMSTVCKTLIHSDPGTPRAEVGNIKLRGRVVRFSEDSVSFDDGTSESGIDHVYLATGFLTSFPFFSEETLHRAVPPTSFPLPRGLYDSSKHVFPLAMDLFPLQANFPTHTVAFMGLPVKVIPCPLFEAQARAIVRVFGDPSAIDVSQDAVAVIARYDMLRSEVGEDEGRIAHEWHRYRGQEQFAYRDNLHAFAGFTDEKWKVHAWEKWAYDNKDILRKAWRIVEENGEAGQWLKGVGEKGVDDWVDMMKRLTERFRDLPVCGTEATL